MRRILVCLVGGNSGITSAGRIEVVLANVGYSGGIAEEESLNGHDVYGIDGSIRVCIGRD